MIHINAQSRVISVLNIWKLCSLCLLVVLSTPVLSGERRAFVVGVNKYDNFSEERQLKNAVSDAGAIAAALESVHFDQVTLRENVSRSVFNKEWQDFLNTIEVGDTAVFYFSGHGVAIEGKNYLLPRSMPYIKYGRSEEIKSESLSLSNLLASLNSREPAVTIMILDACRNNPLIPTEYQRSVIAQGGLSSVSEPPEGTFIMYAAGAGKTALDRLPGDNSPNSVYTRNLLEFIPQPGLNISAMARKLRYQVKQETSLEGGRYTQVPAHYDGLIGEFCFAGCGNSQPPRNIVEPTTGRLTVTVKPEDARVRIMNIKPRYHNGIELKLNESYDILVTSPDYKSYSKSVLLTQVDQILDVELERLSGTFIEKYSETTVSKLGLVIPPPDKWNKKAYNLYLECGGGDALRCRNLGFMYEHGNGIAQDFEKALPLYRKSCDGGDAGGCNNLGLMYEKGKGVTQDSAKAVSLFRQGCDDGNADSCQSLGMMYDLGKGVAQDSGQAVRLYRRVCDDGDGGGCSNLGVMYENGKGVAPDSAKAVLLYRKACDADYAMGCTNLGLKYEKGQGIAQDLAKAVSLYRKGCDGGDVGGCNNLGLMYAYGDGITPDLAKAVSLYRKACDGGIAGGCNNLGLMYELGKGVTQDFGRAVMLYRRVCDGGTAMGCSNLGAMYEKGQGVTQDAERAVSLYRQACDGGNARDCEKLGR